ncbi:hypothetical protein VPH35_017590 [Triticum aestivum]
MGWACWPCYNILRGPLRLEDRDRAQSVVFFSSAAAAKGERARNPNPNPNQFRSARPASMAASLRAAATRMLRPAVLPGEGRRLLVHTQQLSKSTLALEEEHCPPLIQQRDQVYLELSKSLKEKHRAELVEQKKEELYELLANAHANSAASSLDKNLLKDLSTQIKPRLEDPQWCSINYNADIRLFYYYSSDTGVILTILSHLPVGAR